jgi:hypothetical protein
MSGTAFQGRLKSPPASPTGSGPSDRDSRPENPRAGRERDPRLLVLNGLIVVLTLIVGYLLYSLLSRTVLSPPVESERSGVAAGTTIQLDVLNGCGVSNAGTQFTSYLRARGFDVVEIRNYRTFDVDESLVIDRTGDMNNARRVAYALGIGKEHVIQQMNQDYYVDVSVVIGKDYKSLKPSL